MVFDASSDYAVLSFALLHIFEYRRFQNDDIIMHRAKSTVKLIIDR